MARRIFRIPLVALSQQFTIRLAGLSLRMVCRWNEKLPAWVLDVYDADTGVAILLCMPLVTGADLLSQLRHLALPGQLRCFTEGDLDAPPTEANLGTAANLYYAVTT